MDTSLHPPACCIPGARHSRWRGFPELAWLRDDLAHLRRSDPALQGKPFALLEALTYPGLWAVAFHRVAHALQVAGLPVFPRILSQVARFLTGIEIHPGARVGRGFFIDHGSGVVIGETAEIGEHVMLFHQVTLGNADVVSSGKRHPTIGDHVVLGAGAKILGPITVGAHTLVGAGTIVTRTVPSHAVVVGPAGRVVKRFGLPVGSGQPGPGHAADAVDDAPAASPSLRPTEMAGAVAVDGRATRGELASD